MTRHPPVPAACTLTDDTLAVLGKTLAKTVEARTCVRTSANINRSHYQTLAESVVQQLGRPSARGRLAFLEGFSLAALLALLLAVLTPFFYFHYAQRRARRDAGPYRDNFLHATVAHILRHSRDEAQHTHLQEVLQGKDIRTSLTHVLEEHRKLSGSVSRVSMIRKCIYVNVFLLALVVGLFCAWHAATPRRLPIVRIIICAIAFAIFAMVLEFIFFEYVYLKQKPISDARLNHALVCSTTAEFFKAYGETPAHPIECASESLGACTDVLRQAFSE